LTNSKMASLHFAVLLVLLPALALADNSIQHVEVYTADCSDCGMTFLGRIELQVCAAGNVCCGTGILDDPTQDDFNRGTISTFAGDLLGSCDNFDMGNSLPSQISMKLSHHGTDAGKFDNVKVITSSNKVYVCDFHRFLDNEDTETSYGTDCYYE